jgi:hypothetical protein
MSLALPLGVEAAHLTEDCSPYRGLPEVGNDGRIDVGTVGERGGLDHSLAQRRLCLREPAAGLYCECQMKPRLGVLGRNLH